ncbi:MTH1187 family thiamine-binding protein [Candidatus Bathyarchaeota archaeon]|nr:MTH1187 family thiamine-binding protein [Candidatus Bathyarchaeota archaeon]
MIVVEFSIIPIGVGISVSKFLAPALKELEKRGVKYEVTPMCTIFEAESVDEAFEIVRVSHEAVFKTGVKRLVTTVKLDDRRDKERRMEEKVEVLKALLRESR